MYLYSYFDTLKMAAHLSPSYCEHKHVYRSELCHLGFSIQHKTALIEVQRALYLGFERQCRS